VFSKQRAECLRDGCLDVGIEGVHGPGKAADADPDNPTDLESRIAKSINHAQVRNPPRAATAES
jgi:hypothetical protein